MKIGKTSIGPNIVKHPSAEQTVSETSPRDNFRAYLTKFLQVICFEERVENSVVYWEFPMSLQTTLTRHLGDETKIIEQTRLQKLFPFTPGMKVKQIEPDIFLCEIIDEKLKSAYFATVQEIRLQMAGLLNGRKRPPLDPNVEKQLAPFLRDNPLAPRIKQ